MKTKPTQLAVVLSVIAVVAIPSLAQAHGAGRDSMGGGGRSIMSGNIGRSISSQQINMRRGGFDDRAGHNIRDNRGQFRGAGADDGIRHDARDDRGRGRGADDGARHNVGDDRAAMRRAGTDDRAGQDAGDDNNRNRHRRGTH